MAIESKRMQQRYGTYTQFQSDISNLLPHEFASIISGDPNTTSGRGLYFQSNVGDVDRVLTEEDKDDLETQVSLAQATADTASRTATAARNSATAATTLANNAQTAANGAQQDVDSLRLTVNRTSITVAGHTSQINSLGDSVRALNLEMPNKIEQSDLEDYAYSKATVNGMLSNYYPAYTINDMLTFGGGEITGTGSFAGNPQIQWAKLGFRTVSNSRVGGLCIVVLDSPVCTSSNTTLQITLPYAVAQNIKVPIFVGQRSYIADLTAGSNILTITGIANGERISATFGYRISQNAAPVG